MDMVGIPLRIAVIMRHRIMDQVHLIHIIMDLLLTAPSTGEVTEEDADMDVDEREAVEDAVVVEHFMHSVIRTVPHMVHLHHIMFRADIQDHCFLDLGAVKMGSWSAASMESCPQ